MTVRLSIRIVGRVMSRRRIADDYFYVSKNETFIQRKIAFSEHKCPEIPRDFRNIYILVHPGKVYRCTFLGGVSQTQD